MDNVTLLVLLALAENAGNHLPRVSASKEVQDNLRN